MTGRAGSVDRTGRTGRRGLFPTLIETERLRFEPRTPAYVDALELYRICSSDDGIEVVTRYMPWEPHRTPREAFDLLDRGAQYHREGEAAPYVLRPREGEDGAGEIAGLTGLKFDWEKRTATLGIWLRRRFWGRGYSGERAVALAEFAFDVLDLEILSVLHDVENVNSRRAIEKYVDRLGGRREGVLRNELVVDGEPRDMVRYSVSQDEWRDAVGTQRTATMRWSGEEERGGAETAEESTDE
jgi:RimJ/RimL family protein N-acetyltransferase